MHLLAVASAAAVTFAITVQGHHARPFDLHSPATENQLTGFNCDDVNNGTWPPTSLSVELLPADELRAFVSDRKQIVVHVAAGVAEAQASRHTRKPNCDNATVNGNLLTIY